jgi:hypothetical protein
MALTYELIASKSSTGTNAVTFTDIPQTYSDLVIDVNARANESGNYSVMNVVFNNNTSSNYIGSNFYQLGSVGSSGGSAGTATATSLGFGYLGGTSQFGGGTLYIMNYAAAAERGGFWLGSAGQSSTQLYGQTGAFVYTDTSAGITTIKCENTGYIWESGSNFYLYGIKRA